MNTYGDVASSGGLVISSIFGTMMLFFGLIILFLS